MLSPFFGSFLAAATENRILDQLQPILGMPTELLLPVVLAIVAMVLGVLYGKQIRMEDHGWRIGLIAASFLAALSVILFWEYKLGVDLQGGAILVYEVDEKATADNHPQGRADDWQMADLMQVLKKRLNPDGLKEIVIRPFGPKQVEIVVPEVDSDEIELFKKRIIEAGVLRFLILADNPTKDAAVWDAAREQAASTDIKLRKDKNVKDPADPKPDKQVIGFWADIRRKAGTVEPQDFTEDIAVRSTTLLRDGDTGELIATDRTIQDQQDFAASPVQFFHKRGITKVQVLMGCDPENDIRGSDLASAAQSMDDKGRNCIDFIMKLDSMWKMREMTSENLPSGAMTRKLGIIWDGTLESAPAIQSTIGERGQITGDFTQREVREKVELLRSGSMPVVLSKEPISDDRIGATLGADTVKKGSQSIVISLSLVLAFVLVYYRTAGMIACFALLLNVMLTVALMFALRAPFTLPGLAGLVLTVGMSVDANVLIYERLREELEKGASLRMAIRNGFDKALVTIIDSNVTTLLTAVILYVIGTDQVRGFGMTLILGIVTSMFTAIFASRAILEVGEKAYRWQTLGMMKMFSKTNIDWMGTFKPAAVASVVLIAIGLIATVVRGAGIFDIDLAGGTSVQFVLDPKAYPKVTETQVRDLLAKAFADEKVKTTGAKAEHNVYQKFLAQAEAGTEEQMVWKVDSSLEKVEELQAVVVKAFRTVDGKEGIQTYGMTASEIKELQPDVTPPALVPPAVTPPAIGAPENPPETPKVETPKTETPKVETPKTETPKTETPKAEEPKAEPAKTAPAKEEPKAEPKQEELKKEETKTETPKEEPKKSDGEDSSDCQPAEGDKQDEGKKEEPKTDTKPAEDKKVDETKPAEKKAEEPKAEPTKTEPAEPAKTETPKTETPKTETPKTETPKTETPKTEPAIPANDPTQQIPPVVTPGPLQIQPVQPAVGGEDQVRSVMELNFRNTKINGSALQDRLSAAAEKVLSKGVAADVDTRGWNGQDNKSFSVWTVSLPLAKDDAKKVIDQLEKDLAEEPVWQTSSKIGGQVSADTRYRAIGAILGSILGMIVYMWIRFHKISWGIAAAVALAHDALVMLGAIAVSYWLWPYFGFLQVEEFKISLPVVAAFLTLIGYSINDTIVIFDRVREIRGKSPDVTGQMVNDAVNQTLSRSVITAGTTLMVIVILYFLGGSGIHAFAFALVVGIISGTYSTVFIASPLLVYLIGLDQEKSKRNLPSPTSSETRGAA